MGTEGINWPGWETIRLIGRGSFGAVYEIQREIFGEVEKAALKVISIPQNEGDIEELYSEGYDEESITSTFQSHLKSIVAEYSMMRKMNGCVNIVSCDDVQYVQHDDGIGWNIFIKMELLTPLLKVGSADISEETVVKIAKDICNALIVCKKHDIVHRDIKPQNIFVSEYGDYKLGDFGIAKTVEKTMGGTKIGTYKYMAPEVYNNQPYGSSADIYSLGLVLYWLLNERRMPFLPLPPAKLGAGMDEKARIRRLNGETLPSPAHGCKELKAIVLKACAYDPKERYQSAAEMLEELCSLGGASADKKEIVQDTPKGDTKRVMENEQREYFDSPKVIEHDDSDVKLEKQDEVTVSAWSKPVVKQQKCEKERFKRKNQTESKKAWLWLVVGVVYITILFVICVVTQKEDKVSETNASDNVNNYEDIQSLTVGLQLGEVVLSEEALRLRHVRSGSYLSKDGVRLVLDSQYGVDLSGLGVIYMGSSFALASGNDENDVSFQHCTTISGKYYVLVYRGQYIAASSDGEKMYLSEVINDECLWTDDLIDIYDVQLGDAYTDLGEVCIKHVVTGKYLSEDGVRLVLGDRLQINMDALGVIYTGRSFALSSGNQENYVVVQSVEGTDYLVIAYKGQYIATGKEEGILYMSEIVTSDCLWKIE